tara:strand:+ start:430 stop:831 length:402 start_codon:yes stop_codon:yes gene_type:complete
MSFYGPTWPLTNGNKDLFKMNEDLKQQINFELKNLLLTSPGENISDMNYGIGLRRFLFEQNIESVRDSVIDAVSENIVKYMNYIVLNSIEVSSSPEDVDNYSLSLKIVYSIPKKIEQEVFNINIKPETTTGFF